MIYWKQKILTKQQNKIFKSYFEIFLGQNLCDDDFDTKWNIREIY